MSRSDRCDPKTYQMSIGIRSIVDKYGYNCAQCITLFYLAKARRLNEPNVSVLIIEVSIQKLDYLSVDKWLHKFLRNGNVERDELCSYFCWAIKWRVVFQHIVSLTIRRVYILLLYFFSRREGQTGTSCYKYLPMIFNYQNINISQ